MSNSRLAQKLPLCVEDRFVVVIEPKDHPAPDLESRVLNRMHAIEDGFPGPNILQLLRLPQRSLVRALNPNKDRSEIRIYHQLQQLGILGEIQRCLREKTHRIPIRALPCDQVAKQQF